MYFIYINIIFDNICLQLEDNLSKNRFSKQQVQLFLQFGKNVKVINVFKYRLVYQVPALNILHKIKDFKSR